MRLKWRLFSIAAATLAIQLRGIPVSAEYESPVTSVATFCRTYNAAGRYAESLTACRRAAERYRDEQSRGATVYGSYFDAATMLAYAASDEIGLGRPAEALNTALAAHRLVLYVNSTMKLVSTKQRAIAVLATELQRLERRAQSDVAAASLRAKPRPAPRY
ncbi:MAG: hypothetical protein NVS3B16_21700 [Vulcanimicrobiaceae bacterium]